MWKGLVAGAVGGAVGSLAMNRFQAAVSRLFERPEQHPRKRERARQAQGWKEHRERRGGEEENATVKAAAAVADAVGVALPEDAKQPVGNAMHYAFGIATGAAYGAAAEAWPGVTACEGTAFAAVLWLTADEIAIPALKLSKRPGEYPLRVHAMGLASHLVYGFTTELVRRAFRKAGW
jgi:putative membrane protein